MITFRCTHCGLLLQAEDKNSGKQARCPACKNVSAVPSAAATVSWKAPDHIDGIQATLLRADVDGGVSLDSVTQKQEGVPRAAALERGKLTGQRYILEGEIARGGMGAVLKAVDCDIRREFAVKYMLDHGDATKKLRFVEEADHQRDGVGRILGRMDSNGILSYGAADRRIRVKTARTPRTPRGVLRHGGVRAGVRESPSGRAPPVQLPAHLEGNQAVRPAVDDKGRLGAFVDHGRAASDVVIRVLESLRVCDLL